jgi:hypothetical protein
MVMHARSGGNIEIMGLMQGRVDANTLIVIDSFALPVEGTETRVNAQAQAYEFMTNYSEGCEPVGRMEKVSFKGFLMINIIRRSGNMEQRLKKIYRRFCYIVHKSMSF